MTTLISFKKAPKKLMETYKYIDGEPKETAGSIPEGVTILPTTNRGFQKIDVYVQEKMSQYRTRVAIAHELFHVLQFLTGCELDEVNTYKISESMVDALIDKRGKNGKRR